MSTQIEELLAGYMRGCVRVTDAVSDDGAGIMVMRATDADTPADSALDAVPGLPASDEGVGEDGAASDEASALDADASGKVDTLRVIGEDFTRVPRF